MNANTRPLRATIHLAPLVGKRRNAKSLEGSHISVSVFGRYPPMECEMLFVIWRDFRRRLDLHESISLRSLEAKDKTHETPPLFFFSTNASYPTSSPPLLLSTDSAGLSFSLPFVPAWAFFASGPSLNMCTVSCAELTASRLLTTLKLIEYILASRVPRRN